MFAKRAFEKRYNSKFTILINLGVKTIDKIIYVLKIVMENQHQKGMHGVYLDLKNALRSY